VADSRGHEGESPRKKRQSGGKSSSSKAPLSVDSLAQLDALNEKRGWKGFDEAYLQEVRANEGRMERERWQEEKEAEHERRHVDKREEEREKKREKKRRLKQLVEDRQREIEISKAMQRQALAREHEAEVADDEPTTSEENKSQEMDDYWAMRTRHEQEKDQQPVVRSSADGRLRKKRPRLASGSLLEEGVNEKRRKRRDKRLMDGSGRGRTAYTTDSEWRRKRNKRLCKCD